MRLLALSVLLSLSGRAAAPGRERPPDFAVAPARRAAVVREILEQLQAKYVFPELLAKQRPELQRRWASPAFARLDHAWALVDQVNEDLRELFHDRHLSLSLAAGKPPGIFGDPGADDPAQESRQQAFDRRIHYGVVRAEVLAGNVGYLKLDSFPQQGPQQSKAYADAMAFVRDTDALIVDVRENGGGDGDSVAELVGYFLAGRVLLQNETFMPGGATSGHYSAAAVLGPRYGTARSVQVLVSGHTFSAAEEFAYDLQTQKRATLVGERTAGGANHNRFARIAGDFALSIPYGTVKNAVTGTNWEGTGVVPEVAAKAGDALRVAHRLALAKLAASEQDAEHKQRLERARAALE